MKTAKGNNYDTLLNVLVDDNKITLTFKQAIPFDVTAELLDKAIPLISERIMSGSKPAGTLTKQLERIEHHKEQLLDAYNLFWQCYTNMVTPATRTSPIDKARYDMYSSIPDMKMLRVMCALHIGDDKAADYVLPDDKEQLISDTVAAMRSADDAGKQPKNGKGTTQGSSV